MPPAREPTSHERRAGAPWDASYIAATPAPWDIGRPQPGFVRLAAEGAFAGAVLDAGCGTGEHVLLAAALGLDVLGVDVAQTAVARAREKAAERGVAAAFEVADALRLRALGRTFDTVLDCGLFHTFDREERVRYVDALAAVTRPGGVLFVLCLSDAEGPDAAGPHPVGEPDVRAAFGAGSGWRLTALDPDRIETTFASAGLPAWLVRAERR